MAPHILFAVNLLIPTSENYIYIQYIVFCVKIIKIHSSVQENINKHGQLLKKPYEKIKVASNHFQNDSL